MHLVSSSTPHLIKPSQTAFFFKPSKMTGNLPFQLRAFQFAQTPNKSVATSMLATSKKRSSEFQPRIEPSIVDEVSLEEEEEDEQLLIDDFEDDLSGEADDYFDDDDDDVDADIDKLHVGDGSGGGGVSLAGTWWDKQALALAEDVCLSFEGELGIYAFKTLSNSTIQVRIERLTNKSGSPNMEDIEAFSLAFREKLDEAELSKSIPENIRLEVSSPGVERVVRIPEDLNRFKDRSMYVRYVSEVSGDSSSEGEGVFRLVAFDMESKCCTWGLADVRVNREKAGKGRPLSKKQKEWRLDTAFDSLVLVRIYSEI